MEKQNLKREMVDMFNYKIVNLIIMRQFKNIKEDSFDELVDKSNIIVIDYNNK